MGDSYRPSRPDRDRAPLADRITFTGKDNFRPGGQPGPGGNRSEFTFQSQHPTPQFPPTGPAADAGSRRQQRNRGGGPPRGPRRDNQDPSRNGRNNANGHRRGGFRKAAPHERALLRHREGGGPEQTLGVAEGSNRFLNPDDLSDDDEAEMEVESDSASDGDTDKFDANRKVAKTVSINRADGDSEPQWADSMPVPLSKWSNPDPYTALPPPSETTGVKRDVVQLIRKAKNQASEKAASNNAVAANDDFISFGDDDADEGEDDSDLDLDQDEEPIPRRREGEVAMRRQPDSSSQGRNRKRRHEPELEIVPTWEARPGANSTPWLLKPSAYSHLAKLPEKWLHNEILDFYDFVAPQPFEHDARHKLVQRITSAFGGRRWFPQDTGRILCFGSFPAGLYLPTADMDLVYASDRHFNGGPPALESSNRHNPFKNILYKAARRLEDVHIAATRPTVIVGAKVPIIKFQDRITGIDVDISFENLSGVQAQATFDKWRKEYPDMIYMVALVKQFLVMRGLNEVHTGGLGGFSTICLIVSYIQHSDRPENLGECFIGFLQYYGKKFDLSRQRIQMNPAAVVDKTEFGIDGRPERPDGLSIQDPNRLDNNISGGSRKAQDIFRAFSEAHDTLVDRMKLSRSGTNIGNSLLGYILGGNYDTYIMQRRHLKTLA